MLQIQIHACIKTATHREVFTLHTKQVATSKPLNTTRSTVR